MNTPALVCRKRIAIQKITVSPKKIPEIQDYLHEHENAIKPNNQNFKEVIAQLSPELADASKYDGRTIEVDELGGARFKSINGEWVEV